MSQPGYLLVLVSSTVIAPLKFSIHAQYFDSDLAEADQDSRPIPMHYVSTVKSHTHFACPARNKSNEILNFTIYTWTLS